MLLCHCLPVADGSASVVIPAVQARVGIFAVREVAPGEELTYDYHWENYGLDSPASSFTCMCGAKNCR